MQDNKIPYKKNIIKYKNKCIEQYKVKNDQKNINDE